MVAELHILVTMKHILMLTILYMWISTFHQDVLSQDPCPQDCECTILSSEQLSVFCRGKSLSNITSQLPRETVRFQYEAKEIKVGLGSTNFSHLPLLKHLQITSVYDRHVKNRSIEHMTTSQQTVLWPLTELKELKIYISWELATALPQFFKASSKLETLDLSKTRILNYRNLKNTLVGLESAENFTDLKLHNSQTLQYLKNGLILNLTDLLEPLKNCPLENLDISYNALRTIIPGLITNAPKLKYIDVSNNLLVPLVLGSFFMEVVLHPTIIMADFSEQGLGETGNSSTNYTRRGLQRTPVGRTLSTNEQIQPGVDLTLNPVYSANIKCLDLVLDDLCNIFTDDCHEFLQYCRSNHTTFCGAVAVLFDYSSAIPCEYIPPVDEFLNKSCGGCYVFPMLGNLSDLYLQNLNNYDQELIVEFPLFENQTCYNPKNTIDMIDFSYNQEHGFADIDATFSTPIIGFDRLTKFYLSHNNIQHPSPDLGSNLPRIELFDLSYNMLDLVGKNGDFLTGAISVQELNLAGNIIADIPYNRFWTLSYLQTLNLSSNNLQEFNVSIGNLSELSVIDLSNNMIRSLPSSMTSQLSTHAAKLKNVTLKIDLSKNRLLCTCSVRAFTDWVLRQPQNIEFVHFNEYTCLNDDSNIVPFHRLHVSTVFSCLDTHVYIGIGVGSGILVSGIIAGLVITIYRKRWWIRYHYFIARKMLSQSRKQEEANREYQWDAFVSYHHRDRDWVDEILQPELEDKNGIRLCLHERDFEMGEYITELIIGSIEKSRKTLLILSPHFVQSNWCMFEMRMAQQRLFTDGEDVLLLAILKPLHNVQMSKTLKALLEQRNYAEWTEDAYGQKLFWARLISALDVPKNPSVTSLEEEINDAEGGNAEVINTDVAPLLDNQIVQPSTSAEVV